MPTIPSGNAPMTVDALGIVGKHYALFFVKSMHFVGALLNANLAIHTLVEISYDLVGRIYIID